MKSVPVPKNVASEKELMEVPVLEKICPARLTISNTWFGPTATWTSGGVQPHWELSSPFMTSPPNDTEMDWGLARDWGFVSLTNWV